MSVLLKKMSPKTILGEDPKNYIPVDKEGNPIEGATVHLFTIYGTASDVRSGESNFGGWTALIGNFEAIPTDNSDVYQGGQAFLPEPLNSMIASKLREVDAESVDFAVKVFLKERGDLARGYEYIGEPIQDPSASDPLEKMRKMAQAALPAPETVPENSPAKAPAKKTAK